jgi:hypothetical protein
MSAPCPQFLGCYDLACREGPALPVGAGIGFGTNLGRAQAMHVFLSYARADNEIVQALSSVFRIVGIQPWVDEAGLPPGTRQWDSVIRKALHNCRAVIAFSSENARDSHYVAIELEIAKSYEKTVFPVWVSGENGPKYTSCSSLVAVHRFETPSTS